MDSKVKNQPKLGFGLLLLFCSTMFALCAAEIYLRWNPPDYVYMNTRNVVQQTHSEPSTDPEIGYINRAGLVKPFSNREFRTLVRINSHHMRGREYSLAKPPDVKRIITLGPSFVFGWGVEEDETASSLLEKKYLTGVEVLNMGVSGFASNQSIRFLETEGLQFSPDLVILFADGLPNECSPGSYQFAGGRLYWDSVDFENKSERAHDFLLKNIYLYSLAVEGWSILRDKIKLLSHGAPVETESIPVPAPQGESDLSVAARLLERLRVLSSAHRFKIVVVRYPQKEGLNDDPSKDPDLVRLAKMCREKGFGYLDLTAALKEEWIKAGRYPYFKYDDHWNKAGHEAAAKALAVYLKNNPVLLQNSSGQPA